MPISDEMLEILCCPVTKVPVRLLTDKEMEIVNRAVTENEIKDRDGNIIRGPLTKSLITEDKATIYCIDEGIPNMLVGSGIPVDQIEGL